MSIHTIEFSVDDHKVQIFDDTLMIFQDGDVSKPGAEIEVEDMRRMLSLYKILSKEIDT